MRKIGLPFWKVGDNSFGSTIPYIMFAERFGEIVPLMPNHTLRKDLDLIILPGGPDVNPTTYGQVPNYATGKPDLYKEHFDLHYLPEYIDMETPILGICRGHQSMWVSLGGQLIQHMHHETNDIGKDPYTAQHNVVFTDDFTTVESFTDRIKLPVNSRHHQVVDPETTPEGVIILGTYAPFKANKSFTSDSVEMYAHETLPLVGMQWHPEDVYEPESVNFINKVVVRLIKTRRSILTPVTVGATTN